MMAMRSSFPALRGLLSRAAFVAVTSCSGLLGIDAYHEVAGPCVHNADCISRAGGQPAACNPSTHVCAAALSDACTKVVGPIEDDNAILIGSIFSLSGVNQSSGVARTNSVELALGEIAQTVVGLPGGAGGKPRPLVLVECDDQSDNSMAATSAAAHLNDLGVAAVIGPGGSSLVSSVAQTVTIPDGMFLITPSATSTTLTGLNPLVWRTAPSDVVQAVALRDQVSALETAFRAQNPTVASVKLTIVYEGNSYGQGLLDGVSKGLVLNGAPVTDAKNTGLYEPLSYDAATLDPSSLATKVLAETTTPSLLLLFGTSEVITKFMTPVEAGWPMAAPRPLYLLSDAAKKQELLDLVKGNDALRLRVRGTVPGTSSSLFQTFALHYQGKFGAPPSVFGTAGAYDATYILAYTMVSAGGAPTGAAISGAMKKLVGGVSTPIGPDTLQTALQSLGSGASIDIDGASGPLNFDLMAHEAPSDIDVWCVSSANMVTSFQSSGRHFDASSAMMVGNYACP